MIKGTVTETHGERAKVRVNFKETTERGMRAYIDCWNPISAHPGDNVVIEYRKVDEKKAKWFQILLPVLCLAAGGIFGPAVSSVMPWQAFSRWSSGSGPLWPAA